MGCDVGCGVTEGFHKKGPAKARAGIDQALWALGTSDAQSDEPLLQGNSAPRRGGGGK